MAHSAVKPTTIVNKIDRVSKAIQQAIKVAYIFDDDPSKGTLVSSTNREAATIAERAAVGANFTYASSHLGTLRKLRPENMQYLAAKLAKPDRIITSQII